MTKTILLGAAAALVMSTSAFAQSTSASPPGPTSPAPTNNNPATGVENPAMGSTTSNTAGATSNAGDVTDASTTNPAPAAAGSAGQYGSDTATQNSAGAPYNPVPAAPTRTEVNRAGERG